MSENTTETTARDPQGRFGQGNKFGRRFEEGNQAAAGNGGGRPTKAFLERCRDYMDAEGWDALLEIARDPKNRDRGTTLRWLAEKGLLAGSSSPLTGVEIPEWKTEGEV